MDTQTIKSEIHKTVDTLPDYVLSDLLIYVKQIEEKSMHQEDLLKNLQTILDEDKNLLYRLAQ